MTAEFADDIALGSALFRLGENGDWLEYDWWDIGVGQVQWYTMIWMVKKVLATRENIALSKADKKKERREKAKHPKERLVRCKRSPSP